MSKELQARTDADSSTTDAQLPSASLAQSPLLPAGMGSLRILVECEESQEVTKAFRALGHDAYSCDLQPCSGGYPEWHLQHDALDVAKGGCFPIGNSDFIKDEIIIYKWDKVISHPPCDDIALCGAKWFKDKRLSGKQEQSINFFLDIWELSNCVENPKNIMSGWVYLKKWFPHIIERMMDINFPKTFQQKIQPWQFGHGETKETWLWLKELPKLQPTNIVSGREQKVWKMPPSKDRAKLRSKTYPGIATAMAMQWGGNACR